MIDSHAHYSYFKFENRFRYLSYVSGKYRIKEGSRNDIFDEMMTSGVEAYVEPAIDIDSNRKILELYEAHKGFVYPAIGVHPTRTFLTKWKRRRELESLASEEGVVAIGETGLDYHYPRKNQHRLCQKAWFRYQIELAHKNSLPLILHIRKADKDAVKILKRQKKKLHGGVVHCFCGDAKTAKSYISLGLYIGIGGALLQSEDMSADLKEAVRLIPLERILIETDAPFVLPDCTDMSGAKPTKRVRNSSTVIYPVAEEIARLKEVDFTTVAETADNNAKRLFNIV